MKNPHGGDGYRESVRLDYSANTNPLGTPEGVLAAAREALSFADRYPDPSCEALVRAIGAQESLPERDILCGNGAAELIYAYCAALQPKRAVELAPTFSEYSAALSLWGCRVERYPLSREKDFLPEEGLLPFLREKKPETLFLCNPNNPTGRLFPPELLEEILGFCGETGVRLFLDECFLDLSDKGRSLRDRVPEHPELFLLKAFTKTYGMAGLRLGYGLSADGELLRRMAERTPPWNVSSVAQAAGLAALRETRYLKASRELIGIQRPILKRELEALGLWVCPSEANFLLFRGPEGLRERLLEQGVSIRDCGNYSGLGPGWYRAAVRSGAENRQLIEAIGEAL